MGACDFWYEPLISHSPCGTFFPWHGVTGGIPVPDQTRGNYRMGRCVDWPPYMWD